MFPRLRLRLSTANASRRINAIADVRGVGMLRGHAFHEPIGRAVNSACRKNGLLTCPAPDWIGVAPPLVTTQADVGEIISIIEK